MKATTKSSLIGIFIGAAMLLVAQTTYHLIKSPPVLGETEVYYDAQAREAITQHGIQLPNTITDPYYYSDGFQDVRIFIAFSGPRDVLDKIVETKTEKKLSELTVWKDQVTPENSLVSTPGAIDPKYRTMFYDLSRVKRGVFFEHDGEWEFWHLIYDREGGRVYYCFWNM